MRNLLLAVVIAIPMPTPAFSQDIGNSVGFWRGALVRENSVQSIEVMISSNGDSLSGKYAIPEMGLYEQPLREMSYTDSLVSFRILYGPFEMHRYDDIGQMTGINVRWNPPVSMHLKTVSSPVSAEYTTEELTFFNGEIRLTGTLVKPVHAGRSPAVVIVHGSGEQGRQSWEYRSHAYALAKRGIAALMFDKRGVGNSTGDFRTVSFDTLAQDALSGIEALRARSDIRESAVGLLGISQGGWISTIAARRNDGPAFVVLLEGPAVSLEEQEFHRVEYSMKGDGFAREAIDSALAHTKQYFNYVNQRTGWEGLAVSCQSVARANWADYVNTTSSPDDPDLIWWRNNAYDPADDLRTIGAPVLAMFGEIDANVPVEENSPPMKQYLNEAGVNFEIVTIPDLHHSVTTYQGLHGGDTWKWPDVFWKWSRRPLELDSAMTSWILKQID